MTNQSPHQPERESNGPESFPKMTRKVESTSAQNRVEVDSVMKEIPELSPEQIEAIMEKVQDIDASGIAFTSLTRGTNNPDIYRIFSEGLLGTKVGVDYGGPIKSSDEWKKLVYTDGNATVHFNIVGRNYERLLDCKSDFGTKISTTRYCNRMGDVILLFDLKGFKECIPLCDRPKVGEGRKSRTYRAHSDIISDLTGLSRSFSINTPIDDSKVKEELLDFREEYEYCEGYVSEDALPKPDPEYGFTVCNRVSARFFTGIVFYPTRKQTWVEIDKKSKQAEILQRKHFGEFDRDLFESIETKELVEERDPQKISLQANELAKKMILGSKNNAVKLTPIYDIRGNLWWPKKMTYEEVKEYVAERDQKEE